MRIELLSRSSSIVSFVVATIIADIAFAQDTAKPAPDPAVAKAEEAKFRSVKSPVAYDGKSIARGKMIYARYCTECHGKDGKAQIDVVANATNLTNPAKYLHGTTEGEIFHSIRDGAGVDMPPFKAQLTKEEDIWSMVNFIRSLWPEDKRPAARPEGAKADGAAGSAGKPAQTEGATHE